jgi:hypothetical protein
MKTLLTTLLALAISLGLSSQAIAHDDVWFDSREHPHGGQMRMAGPLHIELVTTAGELTIHVSDHGDQAIATEGATARATVLSAGKRSTVRLSPIGGNQMQGKGDFQLDEGMTVVLSVNLPGQDSQQARFTPFQKVSEAPSAEPHDHGGHSGHAHHH